MFGNSSYERLQRKTSRKTSNANTRDRSLTNIFRYNEFFRMSCMLKQKNPNQGILHSTHVRRSDQFTSLYISCSNSILINYYKSVSKYIYVYIHGADWPYRDYAAKNLAQRDQKQKLAQLAMAVLGRIEIQIFVDFYRLSQCFTILIS